MLEGFLVARATGGTADDGLYQYLRREFMADPALCDLLPPFVRTYRNLSAFWPYIQREAERYEEGRRLTEIAQLFRVSVKTVRRA
jgi:hypothetical protein